EVVEACYRAMVAGFIAREQQDHAQMVPVGEADA
ncbi:MAG: chorismate mutase, partial [Variovorax paradoxus]